MGSVPLADHQRHGSNTDGSGRWSGGRVLVLNATYEPINVCTVRRATVLLLKEKAEVIEIGPHDLHWARGSMTKPVVIRLVTYVRIPRDTHKRKITRRAVFARDGWQCMYCGARTSLTVDHVIPRSKGGGSDWENIVASCAPCNRRKGDRLPHQIGMHPRVKPRMPSPNVFIQLRPRRRSRPRGSNTCFQRPPERASPAGSSPSPRFATPPIPRKGVVRS